MRIRLVLAALAALVSGCTLPTVAHAIDVPLVDTLQVASGGYHTCARSAAGAVQCWGRNFEGQTGDGGTRERSRPVSVVGLDANTSMITSGFLHSCALTTGGAVKCWGSNSDGQLGDGTTFPRSVPVDAVGLSSTVVAIEAGEYHTCAVLNGGGVRCWGRNSSGQLGLGHFNPALTPQSIPGLSGIATLSAGLQHTCAITEVGGVLCWGGNSEGELGNNSLASSPSPVQVSGLTSGVTSISAADSFTCAAASGAARCWGRGSEGQLGDGARTRQLVPVGVSGLESGVAEVSARYLHACATTTSGSASCWGYNAAGEVGDGTSTPRSVPVGVIGLGADVRGISSGTDHTCALRTGGRVECWGRNDNGQLGDGTTALNLVPAGVTNLPSTVSVIGAGVFHSCAAQGIDVRCWGRNQFGQLGNGNTVDQTGAVSVPGTGGTTVQLALGAAHSCALDSAGLLYCWGLNSEGQVGDGSVENRLSPAFVTSTVAQVAAGDHFSCLLTIHGGVNCWGRGAEGQMGNGSTSPNPVPMDVSGLQSGVVAITARYLHACALTATGGVKCWGGNQAGELGDGTYTQRNTPIDVVGLTSGVVAISAGTDHTCAQLADGSVRCWGRNDIGGQLGNGNAINSPTPVSVIGLDAPVLSLAAGGYFSCAREAVGVECWGDNVFGELADGTTFSQYFPTRVANLSSDVSALAMGMFHGCAIDSGRARCWGSDAFGQVGNGGRNYEHPAPVLTEVIRIAAATQGDFPSTDGVSTGSGEVVVFESSATTLAPGDSNGSKDIFARNLRTGVVTRVSLDNGSGQIAGDSIEPAVSARGDLVAFVAPDSAVAKVFGESKDQRDKRIKAGGFGVYLRNLITNTTQRTGGATNVGAGTQPTISASGNSLVYAATVTDPSIGTTGQTQVFAATLTRSGNAVIQGPPRCVSCKAVDGAGLDTELPADGAGRSPAVSADGEWVVFETQSKNLVTSSPPPMPRRVVDSDPAQSDHRHCATNQPAAQSRHLRRERIRQLQTVHRLVWEKDRLPEHAAPRTQRQQRRSGRVSVRRRSRNDGPVERVFAGQQRQRRFRRPEHLGRRTRSRIPLRGPQFGRAEPRQ